jgi:hypothetical protein
MTRASDYQSTQDYYKNRPRYFQIAKQLQKQHETRAKSILFRNKLIKDRDKTMYQNEYDRLRGVLAHSVISEQTKKRLQDRVEQIEQFKLA